VGRVVDLIAPPRMGRSFRYLLASSWSGSLANGMTTAAGPLLVAHLTGDARIISLSALLDWLPGMVFGLYAGVLADRHDRRTMIVAARVPSAIALALLIALLASHHVTVWAVLVTTTAMGVADTFSYAASRTVLPMIVEKADLGVANARFGLGMMGINRLAGPPIGAALFAVAHFIPFLGELVFDLLSLLLIARIVLPAHATSRDERSHLWQDLREGWAASWSIAGMRVLNLQIIAFNLAYGCVMATLVLYAREQLRLTSLGYGLLVATIAVGGIVGTTTYGWLERRVRIRDIMRYGLVLEVCTWGVLAWTHHWQVAAAILGLFGIHEGYWGATAGAVQQRAVPQELQGRVGSVYFMLLTGGLVIGAAASGFLAHRFGISAPYWCGFGCAALMLIVLWRAIGQLAHDDAEALAA